MRRSLGSLVLVALSVTPALGQSAPSDTIARHTRFGVGFQSSFPAAGLSATANTKGPFAIQGIVGAFADLKMYAARVQYRFPERSRTRPYLFATAGMWSYAGTRVSDEGRGEETTETAPGFAAGGGLHFHFKGLPNLVWSADAGFASVSFDEVDYAFGATSLGLGVHWYFR